MPVYLKPGEGSIQEAVKSLRGNDPEEKHIIIKAGNHFLDEPLYLGPEDSGLQIEGEEGSRLLGGRPISNWYKKSETLWAAPVPEAKQGSWDFRMLIVNGRYADRARYPEKGFLIHRSVFDVTWKSTHEGGWEREPSSEELTSLDYDPADIGESFVPENAELSVFHMWDESLVGVKSIDREKHRITFTNAAGHPPGAFATNYKFEKRYVVWNTIEGMIKPGNWYLDRQHGEVVYWPLEGENPDKLDIVAPLLENVIIARGDDDNTLQGLNLSMLTITATNAPLMSGAFGAKLFDGAISLKRVEDTHLRDLEIHNVGGHCIKADGNRMKIENCHLHDAGAGAIRYVGSETIIRNNHIHDIGKTFPSAIALYVGATDPNVPEEWEPGLSYTNCTIDHNELHHVPYAAICAGGKNLKITSNLIYEAMQDLYDGAGIYITFCTNALVKHNFIRDIKDSPGAGTSAYYLDEKSIDCLVEENLEINVPRPSHNHISKNNIFRNNFFIIKGKGYFSIERSEGYTFEKNVVVAEGGFDLYDLAFLPNLRNNILYTGTGNLMTKDLDRYTVLKEYALDLKDGNINEDPKLLSYNDGVIKFAEDSPAHKLGIKEIDVSSAGLIR